MKEIKEKFVIAVVFACFFLLMGRLIFLQIIRGDYYRALSFGLHNSFSEKSQKRGEVFFVGGEPVALNRDRFFVFAIPQKIKEKEKVAEVLSYVLNLNKEVILNKLNENSNFSLIKKNLTEEEAENVKKINLTGIFVETESERYYPNNNLASNIIGFVDKNGNGQYGIEQNFDDLLKNGQDLVLTIDFRVQFEAEKLLNKAKENLNIDGGQIIIADPISGKIIAMANFPNFDPNSYQEFAKNLEVFKNPATQNLFEPGSVFKPITMAIAIEEEKINPETTYRDPGEIKIGGWVIKNYAERKYPGDITMTEVLEKSINTGAVFAQRKIENSVFIDYLEKFGFFEPTGIDFPEIFSSNAEIRAGREINLATASFGQGVAITPIQLIKAFSAIANGGNLVTPYLIENIQKERVSKKIISQKTSYQVTQMLVSVVENGFGKKAKIPGYYIAGKTGTALQPNFNHKGYSEKTWQSFIGYFPAFNPKFLVLVKLDNPASKTAEYSATPIFREMAEFLINFYQIPPDYEPNV